MKRKAEFKPDSTGAGLLRRLSLTQRQRQKVLKWFLYSLVCLILLVLQDVIFCRIRLFGGTTDLLPCALLLICVILGAEGSGGFLLTAAVLYYFSGSAPGVYVIVLLPLLGILASIFRQSYLRKGFNSTLLCAGLAVVLYELGVFAMGLLLGLTLPDRFTSFLSTAVISLVTLPVLYPLMQAIGKIGGELWKE